MSVPGPGPLDRPVAPPPEPGDPQAADAQAVGTQPAEAADLLAAVSALRRSARQAARRMWRADPLPTSQIELLHLVAAQPGISVAAAARELRLAPNTVSTLVGRLAAQGLLSRQRSEADNRAATLMVTGKARQRLADWRDLRAELAGQALAQLPAEDRRALAVATPALLRLSERLALL